MMSLKPIEKIYHLLVVTKNFFYKIKVFKVKKISAPVVSVGNLSFGGVGKTPCIIFLAEELSKTKKVSIVTKSYKASLKKPAPVDLDIDRAAAVFGDEACLIQAKLPHCRVWSGPVKYQTALASLIERPEVVLLDDGFSHRQLYRNFDLILIDATVGFQDYQREPISSLVRSSAVIITKVNLSNEESVNKIKDRISIYLPQLKNKTYLARAKTILNFSKENPVWIFCGLAHPQSLIEDLKIQGYKITQQKFYPDHHAYSKKEQLIILTEFRAALKLNNNLRLVCTQKDFVKLTNEDLKAYINLTEHTFEMPIDQKEDLLAKIRKSF
jgi:tetraacyldisaccharide 4'-kinase